ncbi:PNK3P-domain-containing protein [Fomes fomentarius]|nr:PNK3P-domain-containing protein [Fomes fomentarius]
MSNQQYSKKRSAAHLDQHQPAPGPSPKAQKLFPLFNKPGTPSDSNSNSTFRWITPPLGPNKSCLHGVNGDPECHSKVAAFDLDGCLILSSFPKKGTPPSFDWWRKSIPNKLRQVHEQRYSIVIITNQALRTTALINDWKKKIPLIAAALSDIPFRILAATEKDGFRKPIPGMWYVLERIWAENNVQIDTSQSFFIGDAAGRKDDHSSTDRKLALNIGIPFFTPEEYFLGLPAARYTLPGFHPSSLPSNEPHLIPAEPPILPAPSSPELVLFVGYPALGKTSFFRTHFAPVGYTHINQDTLKTRDKCVKATAAALKAGQNVVVDNTNRDVQTRKFYLDLAKQHKASVRCFHFTGSFELAWHNNLYRAFNLSPSLAADQPKRELLPMLAFNNFRKDFQEPTVDEGFSEVRKVNWVFEGDEEARKRWNMWLQIGGK